MRRSSMDQSLAPFISPFPLLLLLLFLLPSCRPSSAADPQVPTAVLDAGPAFTNAENITVVIKFSHQCPGQGGFQCSNGSNCDLLVIGDGRVLASSLEEIQVALEYRIVVLLSAASTGKVILGLADGFCSDLAGNKFKRTEDSLQTIRFDRMPVQIHMWTNIPQTPVEIDYRSRTLEAANKLSAVLLYLDFSQPILNSSEEVLKVLKMSQGVLKPVFWKSRGNRRFRFAITNLPSLAVATINFHEGTIIGRTGTPVLSPQSITFLYDSVRPRVKVVPSSTENQDNYIDVTVQFSKPVVSFRSSSVTIVGGSLIRFQELSKNIYALGIKGDKEYEVLIFVAENMTMDIARNLNFPSNVVRLKHYSIPAVSVALSSLTTVGILATSFTAGILSISSSILSAADAHVGRTGTTVTNPSRNLLGMFGHLQIFALSDWLVVALPIEYHETVKGLHWLIPRAKLPWEKRKDELELVYQLKGPWHVLNQGRTLKSIKQSYMNAPISTSRQSTFQLGTKHYHRSWNRPRLRASASLYGPPLNASEYAFYFKNLPSFSSDINVSDAINYTGWHDFYMNMFWIGVIGGGLILLQLFVFVLLRWRIGTNFKGFFLVPRFGMFVLTLVLPGMGQALGFIFRGGTMIGIVVGVLLLSVPVSFLLSVALFLAYATSVGKLVQYKEIRWQESQESFYGKLIAVLIGAESLGKWVPKHGLSSHFIQHFGSLFEDRKGIPRLVVNKPLGGHKSGSDTSRSNGIGRMSVKEFDNEEGDHNLNLSMIQKVVGVLQMVYILVDLARRVSLGVVFGFFDRTSDSLQQFLIAALLTSFQSIYLFALKPYISRGVHVAEATSLFCEVAVFVMGMVVADSSHRLIGFLMILALMTSFVLQLGNEWYALVSDILKLTPTMEPSLGLGLKMILQGLVLPFTPHKMWPKLVASRLNPPQTGLVSVVLQSSLDETKALPASLAHPESIIMPRLESPSIPNPITASLGEEEEYTATSLSEEIKPESSSNRRGKTQLKTKSVEVNKPQPNELSVLRQLAKASFPSQDKSKDEEETNPQLNCMRLAKVSLPPQDKTEDEEKTDPQLNHLRLTKASSLRDRTEDEEEPNPQLNRMPLAKASSLQDKTEDETNLQLNGMHGLDRSSRFAAEIGIVARRTMFSSQSSGGESDLVAFIPTLGSSGSSDKNKRQPVVEMMIAAEEASNSASDKDR